MAATKKMAGARETMWMAATQPPDGAIKMEWMLGEATLLTESHTIRGREGDTMTAIEATSASLAARTRTKWNMPKPTVAVTTMRWVGGIDQTCRRGLASGIHRRFKA